MVNKSPSTQKAARPQTEDVNQLADDILAEIRGLAYISERIEQATNKALKKIDATEKKIQQTQLRVEKEIQQTKTSAQKSIQQERDQARKVIESEKTQAIKATRQERDQGLSVIRREFAALFGDAQKKINDLSKRILGELRKRGL